VHVPDGYTKPLPESGDALYITNLLLPIMRHDDNAFDEVRVVPMVQSRN
jgi:hypothetical protein